MDVKAIGTMVILKLELLILIHQNVISCKNTQV